MFCLGPVVGEILEDIIPVLVANLQPEKDPEVKLKMFSLLSRLMMKAPETVDSQQRCERHGLDFLGNLSRTCHSETTPVCAFVNAQHSTC